MNETRKKYIDWLSKGVRTKTEMAAYQQGAGRVTQKIAADQSSRKPQNNPKPSNLTRSPAFNYGTNIKHPDIPEKKELLKEKSVVERQKQSLPALPIMEMPMMKNLSIINGDEHRIGLKERKMRRGG